MIVSEFREFLIIIIRSAQFLAQGMLFVLFQDISRKIVLGTVTADATQVILFDGLDYVATIVVIKSPPDKCPGCRITTQYRHFFVCFKASRAIVSVLFGDHIRNRLK